MKNLILVLNCGSSSIKFAVVDPRHEDTILTGLIQRIGSNLANLKYQLAGASVTKDLPNINYREAIIIIANILKDAEGIAEQLLAVGHRVVHGGEHFTQSVIIDEHVIKVIRSCIPLAPLHNPANLTGIEEACRQFPTLKQVAVFDTAFHQTMPERAYIYSIPYELYQKHQLRRYGFHGTSHDFVSKQAAELLGKNLEDLALVTAHLGNGCSVTAISQGKSMDTSMGLTPLEGLVMGTRSGDLDPGLPNYLAKNLGYDIEQINRLLNHESGMLGISGVDSDFRAIESAAAQGNQRCQLALEIFCYQLAKYVASYLVTLGKLDALVFTGGVGENSQLVRSMTIGLLAPLGFTLNAERNRLHGRGSNGLVTEDDSIAALVVPTNEELRIAQDCWTLVKVE